MWKDCMATVAIITVCVMICMAVGIPMGVIMARSNRAEKTFRPESHGWKILTTVPLDFPPMLMHSE